MKKRGYIFTFITIVCLTIMMISSRNTKINSVFRNTIGATMAPIQRFFSSGSRWIANNIRFVTNIKHLQKENDELKMTISKLENNLRTFEKYEQENRDLRNKLDFKANYVDFPLVGAEIIAKDSSNWTDFFLIDKGQKDGLKEEMVVLTEKGLVGTIVEVGPNYAKVRTILHEDTSVAVEVKRTTDFGIITGDLSISKDDSVKMTFIDPNAELIAGDEIITSGLGGLFPKGIFIGKVVEIKKESYQSTKYAIIKSDIDFKKLDKVLVIKYNWGNYKNILGE